MVTELDGAGNWARGEVFARGVYLATYANATTTFAHADWLGTIRYRTNLDGSVAETCTGNPFGDGPGCTGTRPSDKYFTGQLRDYDTGLDYFGARYFASAQGRFLTPDWSATPEAVPYGHFETPQSLNLYAYVKNNPVTDVDVDGHDEGFTPPDETFNPRNGGGKGPGDCLECDPSHLAYIGLPWRLFDPDADESPSAQQQVGQDPTLPTAVDQPPPPLLDRLLLPQSKEEAISLAIMVGTEGLGEVGELGIKLLSSIGEDTKLVKYAEDAGKSVQKGLDHLVEELGKGNTNPGLGTKGLGNGISYARARDGARVFFKQAQDTITILAKASKANESQVINYLKSLF